MKKGAMIKMVLKHCSFEKQARLHLMYQLEHEARWEELHELMNRPNNINYTERFQQDIMEQPDCYKELDLSLIKPQTRALIYDSKANGWWMSLKDCKQYYHIQTKVISTNRYPFLKQYSIVRIWDLNGCVGTSTEIANELGMSVFSLTYLKNTGKCVLKHIILKPKGLKWINPSITYLEDPNVIVIQ